MIVQFLTDYGYWVILPLMIIEGPIVTILAAFMATQGIFDVRVVLVLSIIGDITGDIMLYAVGRVWGMTFVRRVGKYMGITESLVLKMKVFFERHGGKTIFSVKSTTGLCWATWVAAGIVKMNFGKFVWYSFLGGIVWSAFLVFMGYFFGEFYAQIEEGIKFAGWIVLGIAIGVIVVINVYKKKKSEDLFEKE